MSTDEPLRRRAARDAGLRWSTDERPGISRRRRGRGWSYRDADGSPVRDDATLARIRALAIPPAWTGVWICPDPRGHLQATGRDARGRKQHRYHAAYREHRESAKFATMRDRHATVTATRVRFRFRGKSGVHHEVSVRDRRLARIVGRCQDLPGQDLLQYVDDDGEVRDVRFRTWAGTVLAYRALLALQPVESERDARHNVVEAVRQTAETLGNTPAVARRSYVHPAVLEAYLDGAIGDALMAAAEDQATPPAGTSPAEEAGVIAVLRQRLELDAGRGR